MKYLAYSIGIIVLIMSIVFVACQKQNDPQPLNPAMNGDEIVTITICHTDGSNWFVIDIDQEDWSVHEAHGDMFWQEFPRVGIYNWIININGVDRHNTMYITEINGSTFDGYGVDQSGDTDADWDIVDGTINGDGSISYTMDYQNSNYYLDCTGSFECGVGISGTAANGTESGSWTANYNGGFSDESGLEEINP